MADSFNELFGLGSHGEDASLKGWWLLQDDAANTTVADQSSGGNDGTLNGGDNTDDISTTGPNNWLTKALQLNGTDDFISLGDLAGLEFGTGDSFSWGLFCNPDAADEGGYLIGKATSNSDVDEGTALYWDGANEQLHETGGNSTSDGAGSNAVFTDTDWALAGVSSTGGTATFYRNGSSAGSDTYTAGQNASTAADARIGNRSDAAVAATLFAGGVAGAFAFGRSLSAGEHAQINAGPEPVNSVAPALSGAERVGQTLSCTSGTWGLDSPFSSGGNGTITYSYQWTRSNDAGGTGESDIGGATSGTYTLVSADEGKYLRCRVRASNTGGYDADADTNSDMSGAIEAAPNTGAALLMAMIGQ